MSQSEVETSCKSGFQQAEGARGQAGFGQRICSYASLAEVSNMTGIEADGFPD